MKRTLILLLLMVSAGGLLPAQAAKPPDPWARLNFLVGEWEGTGGGAPGAAIGGTTFAFDLDKNILARKNWAKYPPKPGEKTGLSHEDLLFIFPLPGESSMRAIYFDNESHVINYTVSFPQKGDSVIFESDPAQKGPRFRMTYELNADKTLKNVFFIAPPGQEFKPYVEGLLKKKR